MKLSFGFGIVLIAIAASAAIFVFAKPETDKIAQVTMLNVGQGDAILVELPNKQRWLIDGGPDSSVVSELHKVLPFADRQLTGIILTHPHSDHVTGLVSVLEQFQVSYALFTPVVHTSPIYKQFLETVQRSGVEVIPMVEPFAWQGEGWCWEFLYPISDSGFSNLNDSSIVSRLVIGEHSFLFMGDAEAEVEQLLVQQRDLSSTVLKVGHHGSDTSTTEDLMAAVRPEFALISAGKNNRFQHPSGSVLDILNEFGVEIFRTDEDGRITVTIDINGLTIVKE